MFRSISVSIAPFKNEVGPCHTIPDRTGTYCHARVQCAPGDRNDPRNHRLDVQYVPIYAEHVICGLVDGKAQPEVEQARPSSIRVDASFDEMPLSSWDTL
jgi:hypothetical protein